MRTGENQDDRLGNLGIGRNVNESAVAHESGVERNRRVPGLEDLAHMSAEQRIAVGERFRHRGDDHARFSARIGLLRLESAVNEDEPGAFELVEIRFDLCRRGRGIRQRQSLAHESAQVGIFPFLDPAIWQSLRFKTPEGVLAQRSDRAFPGQPDLR